MLTPNSYLDPNSPVNFGKDVVDGIGGQTYLKMMDDTKERAVRDPDQNSRGDVMRRLKSQMPDKAQAIEENALKLDQTPYTVGVPPWKNF